MLPGFGLVLGAGLGGTIGLLPDGADLLPLAAALGAGLGLVLGAMVASLLGRQQTRSGGNKKPSFAGSSLIQ